MARLSAIYELSNSQAELDFIDIDTSTDTRLYIDPYAIQIRDDAWSAKCGDFIRSFFNEVLDALRNDNFQRATHLLDNLHEPNETFLGQSTGRPRGRGIGRHKAQDLTTALQRSRALRTGLLSDISETELFIHGVGPDTISDLTTNILRGPLSEYTAKQCELHGIPTEEVRILGPIWRPDHGDWQSTELQLPIINQRPVMLVPKYSVRHRLSLDSQEFWNHHMSNFLQSEYLAAGGALVQTFKDGTPYVTKKSVQKRHPLIKDDLATFVREHPEVLENYKRIKGAKGTLELDEIEDEFDERAFATVLIDRLREIPRGSAAASEYHSITLGICTFLFCPFLIYPIKEHEVHEGRKRVNIKFTNAAESGFFHSMLASPQTRSISVMIECKNYTKEMNNPELDQLAGRFGHQRGFFGMLLCRNMDNRNRIVSGCRDAASDGRGFMLVLEDADLIEILEMITRGSRRGLDNFLHNRFDEITD